MNETVSEAFDQLANGFDPHSSPFHAKVVVMTVTAQGIIDNGGFEYFFESPFDGNPDLGDFVRAFEAIGAEESAKAIEAAIIQHSSGSADLEPLNEVMWSQSAQNYERLERFVQNHGPFA